MKKELRLSHIKRYKELREDFTPTEMAKDMQISYATLRKVKKIFNQFNKNKWL